MQLIHHCDLIRLSSVERIESRAEALRLIELGQAVMVNTHSLLTSRRPIPQDGAPAISSI